jgi:hypothetical protein
LSQIHMSQMHILCQLIQYEVNFLRVRHNLFSITKLFVRLFVRDNVCSHAESAEFPQRIIISHRKHRKHRNLLFPADNVYFVPQKWRKSRIFDSQSDWREVFL